VARNSANGFSSSPGCGGLPSALRTLPLNGLRYSHTISPARVTSNSSPPVPAAIRVLPFSSRCAPEMNGA
jgi:hypothetical protein